MLKLKTMILIAFVILISSLSCASAQDSAEQGNFTQLNEIVENSDDIVNLFNDYTFVFNDSNLNINKAMKIIGNNHQIDFNGSSMVIKSNESIVFDNISFKHFSKLNLSDNLTVLNLTFMSCSFYFNNHIPENVNVVPSDYGQYHIGEISPHVKDTAKKIVGKKKGIAACKKLAKWVGSNISHETKEGFYQSPEDTLLRKKGNCCSQTILFLQMCDAVGALKGHKAYFIHVGTKDFGNRHFFCMIDDVVIDVDEKAKSPWGKAGFNGRDVYRITQYPYLPLPRHY